MPDSRFALHVILVAALAAATRPGLAAGDDPGFATGDDPVPSITMTVRENGPGGFEIRVGTFRTWENRAAAAGRVLELDVVVLPALAEHPAPDPIFYIAGGPGQAAARLHGRYARSWMRRDRDIVLVSQRGTGGSNRLGCDLRGSDRDLQGYFEPIFDRDLFETCLAELAAEADLTRYSTPIAMDDLDDVRRLLGYERVNLMGGSYGTRASLVYLRRHPETVRSVILNGVAPVSFVNPLYHAREAQAALDLIMDECAEDPACAAAFPDLRREFQVLLERLSAEPAVVEIDHPLAGTRTEVRLSRDAFAGALRIVMYYNSRDVPLLIHRAFEGDYEHFARTGLEASRGLRGQLSFGMLLCVTCAEDVARIDPDLVAGLTAGTFLGDGRVREQMAVCAIWPRSELPPGYAEPVRENVPVLLLSGTLDPVTPPRWGAEAARHLPDSLHLIVPGGHGVGGPCIDRILRQFLEQGSLEDLDVSCTAEMSLPPFTLP